MKVKDDVGEKVTRAVCSTSCLDACGLLVHTKDGILTKVEPADFPESKYRFACRRALATPKLVHHPDRLKYPMKRVGERGEGKWERITWDEALDTITSKFKDIAAKYGPESVAMLCGALGLPGGPRFIGRRFANAIGATWVTEYAAMTAAQCCADLVNYGKRWSVPYLEDFEDPRMWVIWGGNSVETWPWKYRQSIMPAREKGARMVAINPLFTSTAAKADEWVPIRVGTDTALALGMVNIIVKEGLYDEAFLLNHTDAPFLVRDDNGLFMKDEQSPAGGANDKHVAGDTGFDVAKKVEYTLGSSGKNIVWDTKTNKPQVFDAPGITPAMKGSYTVNGIKCRPVFQLLAEIVEQYPLEKTSEITEVSPEVIRKLAHDYATLKPVVSERGIGLQRQFHGDLTYRAITTLAAVTGNINLKEVELDPLQALNWIPFMMPGGRMSKQFTTFQFYNCNLTGKPYPIKAFWASGQNPANSHANRNKILELLKSMEFIVASELFMTATAEYADIVLPVCTLFECTNFALGYTVTWGGGHPYFQLQPKVIEPLYESKSDLEIFNALAPRMGVSEFFDKSEEEYMEILLSSKHPSMEGITLENLKKGPMKPKAIKSPFTTPTGRIGLYSERLREFGQALPVFKEPPESARQPLAKKYPLVFLQLHSKARSHAQLARINWLKELDPEPLLNMNPMDAEKRGIKNGDMVMTFNDRGKVKLKARVHEGIRPGVVVTREGWQPRDFAEGSYQELTGTAKNPAQEAIFEPVATMQGVLVEVKKA